jgi:hypothetical protein
LMKTVSLHLTLSKQHIFPELKYTPGYYFKEE